MMKKIQKNKINKKYIDFIYIFLNNTQYYNIIYLQNNYNKSIIK